MVTDPNVGVHQVVEIGNRAFLKIVLAHLEMILEANTWIGQMAG